MAKLRPICSVCKGREHLTTTSPPAHEQAQVDDNHKTQTCGIHTASIANAEAAVTDVAKAVIATELKSKTPCIQFTDSPPIEATREFKSSGRMLETLTAMRNKVERKAAKEENGAAKKTRGVEYYREPLCAEAIEEKKRAAYIEAREKAKAEEERLRVWREKYGLGSKGSLD